MGRSFISSLIIGLALIITASILAATYRHTHIYNETISVTGLSQKNFSADLIVWNGNFSRKSDKLQDAYSSLRGDEQLIQKYLKDKGVKDGEMIFSSVSITKDYKTIRTGTDNSVEQQIFDGYTLTQNVHIESSDVNKIEGVSREITELIDENVEFSSESPQYFYTKLSELKLDLLADAAKDGRIRAQKIADNAGNSLGDLKRADMGVFQITAQNSSEDYSSGGELNTSSRNKTASITVHMDFSIK